LPLATQSVPPWVCPSKCKFTHLAFFFDGPEDRDAGRRHEPLPSAALRAEGAARWIPRVLVLSRGDWTSPLPSYGPFPCFFVISDRYYFRRPRGVFLPGLGPRSQEKGPAGEQLPQSSVEPDKHYTGIAGRSGGGGAVFRRPDSSSNPIRTRPAFSDKRGNSSSSTVRSRVRWTLAGLPSRSRSCASRRWSSVNRIHRSGLRVISSPTGPCVDDAGENGPCLLRRGSSARDRMAPDSAGRRAK